MKRHNWDVIWSLDTCQVKRKILQGRYKINYSLSYKILDNEQTPCISYIWLKWEYWDGHMVIQKKDRIRNTFIHKKIKIASI